MMYEVRVYYTNLKGLLREKVSIVGDVFNKLVAADCVIYKMLQEKDILRVQQIEEVRVKQIEDNESVFLWNQLGRSNKELAKSEYILSETYYV